jgi:transglutaminase-like putative cysteine protease
MVLRPASDACPAGGDVTRYAVRHRSEYAYDEAMTQSASLAHLMPGDTPYQRVISSSVVIDPEPDQTAYWIDRFGNRVMTFTIEEPHRHLRVEAVSEVDIDDDYPLIVGGPTWEEVVAATRLDSTDAGLLARACSVGSRYVTPSAELREYAMKSFPAGRPIRDALAELTVRIRDEFTFDPSFSDVSTPLTDVLAARRGVCQDFAHLEIGCLRSLGLGVRYVSGYIETNPPPGRDRLVGADASHAWCATYIPGDRWLDLDPTNGLVHAGCHVTVGVGRDYADVAPLYGVVYGPTAGQRLDVAVDVQRLS